jgi:glycosyltransferase involved in cell wall biosynthesis
MLYIAWFVFVFTMVQLLIAFVNLVFNSKLVKGSFTGRVSVSVLIPARNEEKNIGNILNDLLKQDYQDIEVIVFNDISSDRTAHIVREFAASDRRIRLMNSEELPEGWLGKNWACYSLSKQAGGKYLLFLDADVRISNGLIVNAISYAERFGLALVSIFPKQIMKTTGEKITVPNMNYILLSLLPLILVRKLLIPSLSAANGQFMLFASALYMSLEPHKKFKSNKVEDIEIARYLKKEKHQIACMVGDNTIQCRMYNNFNEAVNGFSKNVSAFFGNSILLSLIFWFITTFGFLFILFEMSSGFFLAYLIAYLAIRIIISVISEQKAAENLLFLIPQQFSCGLFIYYAFINKRIRTYQWKGRNIK